MTTTNQAFIKAYRHDAAETGQTGPAANTARPELAQANTPAATPAAATGERSALYGPRPASAPLLAATPPSDAVATPKRPLSAFIGRRPKASPDAPAADADFLRPGTMVASFQWPQVCRTLAQQHGSQLAAVADRLLHEANTGRTLIGVLGLRPRVGTTTAALCLAARLARAERRVILVDGNFTNPCLAAWLEAAPTSGWQDVLKHGGPLADAVIRAQDDHLDLLALDARKPANPQKLVGGLQAVVTAGVLRHAYDLVLIDIGAYFDSASQPIVLELVRNMGLDAALAVCGPTPAAPSDTATVANSLSRSGCELLGIIENRVAA
jgi:Mrp family chromosome partitioning ATPase